MLNFRKTKEPIARKLLDGRTEGRKDRQTLIYRNLPTPIEGLIKGPPYPEFPVSKKNLYFFKCFIAFPVKLFFKETKI